MKNLDQNLWTHYQNDDSQVFTKNYGRHKEVLAGVKKHVKSNSKILEIGFGDGFVLKQLSKSYECYGADISKEVIDVISKNITNVKFNSIGIDGKLSYANNYFNALIASEVLEHMNDSELKTCVEEIYRIVKKNAYIFITLPAEEILKDNECFCPNCETKFHRWGHKQSWNEGRIRETFNNFEILNIKSYFIRYEGNSLIDKVGGYIFYMLRNIINKFNKLPNRSYLIILRKK